MPFSLDSATLWTERAIALSVLLQTVELLQCRKAFADDGIWRWQLLRPEHQALPAPLRWLFAACLPYRSFIGLLLLELVAAVLLGLGVSGAAPFLCFAQLAVCVRFRGTFNGGSDYLTLLILMALSLAWLFGAGQRPLLAKACIAYIAVQVTLSYFIAGLAKLKEAAWRDGTALRAFTSSQRHGAPAFVRQLLDGRRRCLALSWSVLLFECAFPLAWLDPRVCSAFLALGLGFHFGNSVVFGLNRFLFAWSAAYPALLFCSQLFAHAR
jgi:hypothetical protein